MAGDEITNENLLSYSCIWMWDRVRFDQKVGFDFSKIYISILSFVV